MQVSSLVLSVKGDIDLKVKSLLIQFNEVTSMMQQECWGYKTSSSLANQITTGHLIIIKTEDETIVSALTTHLKAL